MTLSEKLYKLRRSKGYSQEELAEKLGVSRQAVSKWERGDSSPDTNNLIAVASLYEIPVDELAGCIRGDKSVPAQPETTAASGISLNKADYIKADIPENKSCAESTGIAAGDYVRMSVPDDDGEIYPQHEIYPQKKFGQQAPEIKQAPEFVPMPDPQPMPRFASQPEPRPIPNVVVQPEAQVPAPAPQNNFRNDPASRTYDMSFQRGLNGANASGTAGGAGGGKKSMQDILSPASYSLYKKLMRFPYWAFAILIFFLGGGLLGLWEFSWMIFLTIPLYYTAVQALFRKNALIFCFPVLMVLTHLTPILISGRLSVFDVFDLSERMTAIWSVVCYLMIPLYYTGILAFRKKDVRIFCFPVLVVMAFVSLGLLTGNFPAFLWLFGLIPFYYYFWKKINNKLFGTAL